MSTPTSRRIRFAKTTNVARMVIHGEPVIILNPTICYAGKTYRLELDPPSRTGWIRKEES